MATRRSMGGGGGGGGFVNKGNNRFSDGRMGRDNRNNMNNMNMNNNYGPGGGGGWRGGPNQGRQNGGHQGGGMNVFDNRPFQPPQMNQNQFANQFSNAVLRSSVGSNPGMMSSFGGNQDQPVVMVLPQSQSTGGMMGNNMGNMGMVQSQNPFAAAVMNQQKPMQVIVGNLPGLNPAAFGQQVLPAYGEGVGEQNMGIYNQQTQQGSNRYGRDFKNSSDRGRPQNQRNQKVSLVRRTEANDRGRVTAQRGVAKKRGQILRDPFPDNKKAKLAGVATARNRVGIAGRKDRMKNRRPNPKVAGNKNGIKTEDAGKTADAKSEEAKTEEEKAAETAGVEAESQNDGEPKPSKYDEIPVELLVCKICQKTSSDAAAFESHLTGKPHLTLMKILEEKFQKRVQLLMLESKMCEDEIAVEMERQRRAGKPGHGKGSKHHCKMCDCNYTVNWGTHKQSVWHRVLKEFLHPTCRFCKNQFVHRRDWVEHIFSVAHMKKLVELKQEGKISVTDQERTTQEELFSVYVEIGQDEKPVNIVHIHSLGGREPLTDDVKDMLKEDKGELVLPEGEIPIPTTYDENVSTGEDAIIKVGGTCCKVCRIYVKEGEDAAHCKSRQHFDSYVEYLKRVVRLREQKAAEEKKAKEEAERKVKAAAEAAAKAEADAAAKLVAEAAAAEKAATEANAAAEKSASPTKAGKTEAMEVDQSGEAQSAVKDDSVVVEEVDGDEGMEEADQNGEAEDKMDEGQAVAESPAVKAVAATPVKADSATSSPAKPALTPKTPQRGGQNNRGARGSPARGGRGGPNRGGGGFNRGRGGVQQQQQTPVRNNSQPRVDSNMRGGNRGGPRGGRGGARGSPGRGRGRGW